MKLEASKGNVFDDIAESPEQAAELKAKALLMDSLISYVQSSALTNASAAELLKVSEGHIEHLLAGRINALDHSTLQEMATLADASKTNRDEQ